MSLSEVFTVCLAVENSVCEAAAFFDLFFFWSSLRSNDYQRGQVFFTLNLSFPS